MLQRLPNLLQKIKSDKLFILCINKKKLLKKYAIT